MSKKRKRVPPEPDPPEPEYPYSFQQVVEKILDNKKFAEFIHGEILKARDSRQPAASRQAAANKVSKYFHPLDKELTELKLPQSLLDNKDVNDIRCTTTHMLLDFATPAQIWRK